MLPRLLSLWKQIAARYKDRPKTLLFELFNEPQDKFTDEIWNAGLSTATPDYTTKRSGSTGHHRPRLLE